MLSDLCTEVANAYLIEPQENYLSDVDGLVFYHDHPSEGQGVVQHYCSCINGGLELEQLGRSYYASEDAKDGAKNSHSWADEEVGDTDALPVIKWL